jgi:hypothetical protein
VFGGEQVQTIHPTSSYQIELPDGFLTDEDRRVSSFWLPDDPLVLQLSSYLRLEGEQVDALTRLNERMEGSSGPWQLIERRLNESPGLDEAAGEQADGEGNRWIHAFLVWPHFFIYVTLIGPEHLDWRSGNWGFEAIRTIAPIVH